MPVSWLVTVTLALGIAAPEGSRIGPAMRPVTPCAIAAGIVAAAVASALLNRWLAKKAERRNPPIGRFVTVGGTRLHYVDRGTGTPLILLHGNGDAFTAVRLIRSRRDLSSPTEQAVVRLHRRRIGR